MPLSSLQLSSPSLSLPISCSISPPSSKFQCSALFTSSRLLQSSASLTSRRLRTITASSHLCTHDDTVIKIEKPPLILEEGIDDGELWAASCLRVRCFNDFQSDSFGIEDRKKYLAEREFEALKERVTGKREGFSRVSCINATLPLSQISTISEDLCAACKFSDDGDDRVVVGSLDLNQCVRLPDEIIGKKPEGGIGADFARAYLSNVCVAKELQRNGLGYELIATSKIVAQEWGIKDLYVHVAFDNEAAKNLYKKSGFEYESEEPAWQARFLDRPRRILLWTALPCNYEL